MIGVELSNAGLTDVLLEGMKDAGFLLGKTGPGRNVLTLMPPLVVDEEALDSAVQALDRLLTGLPGV